MQQNAFCSSIIFCRKRYKADTPWTVTLANCVQYLELVVHVWRPQAATQLRLIATYVTLRLVKGQDSAAGYKESRFLA